MTLLAVVAVFTALSFAILRTIIAPAFDDLEMEAAATDILRVEGAMQTNVDNLTAITADWAPWDDIFFYVRGENPGFQKSNLIRPTLENLDLDFIAVYSRDRTLMWSQVLIDEVERPISDLRILNVENDSSTKLTSHSGSAGKLIGIVQTGLGPALISSRAIVRSDESGPVSGTIVMAIAIGIGALTLIGEEKCNEARNILAEIGFEQVESLLDVEVWKRNDFLGLEESA